MARAVAARIQHRIGERVAVSLLVRDAGAGHDHRWLDLPVARNDACSGDLGFREKETHGLPPAGHHSEGASQGTPYVAGVWLTVLDPLIEQRARDRVGWARAYEPTVGDPSSNRGGDGRVEIRPARPREVEDDRIGRAVQRRYRVGIDTDADVVLVGGRPTHTQELEEDSAAPGEPPAMGAREVRLSSKRTIRHAARPPRTDLREWPGEMPSEPLGGALVLGANEDIALDIGYRQLTKLGSEARTSQVASQVVATHLREVLERRCVRMARYEDVQAVGLRSRRAQAWSPGRPPPERRTYHRPMPGPGSRSSVGAG